jgi:Sugar (and other) transporter
MHCSILSSSCWFKVRLYPQRLDLCSPLTRHTVTPIAIEAISWKFFLIFVICDIIFIVIFYLFFPETKNKTLEEIGAIFGDDVSSKSPLKRS